MYIIIAVVIGVLLFVAGVMDLKSKTISRKMIWILAIAGLTSTLTKIVIRQQFELWEITGGVLIGLCSIGLLMISKEQIGRGDGFVITALGLALGFTKCLYAVCIASIIMTVVSVFILVLRKGNRTTRVPFIPALFAGYMVCIMTIG